MNYKGWSGQLLRGSIFAFLIVIVLAPAARSQSSQRCYTAEIPVAFVMPDDSVHDAGELEICLSRMFSPVTGFHRVSIDGRVAGLYRSRVLERAAGTDDERSYFVFVRLPDGTYELDSYTDADVRFEMRGEVRTRWRVGRTGRDVKVDSRTSLATAR